MGYGAVWSNPGGAATVERVTPDMPEVLVLGSGVIGLTTAVRTAEAGYRTRVLARDPITATASAAAGAFWGPFLARHRRTRQWSLETLDVLRAEALLPGSGVDLVHGLEAARVPMPIPEWIAAIEDCRPSPPEALPSGFATGWRYTVPVIDMPRYLERLTGRLRELRVKIERGAVGSLADPTLRADVIVNCTGSGSRELVPDPGVYPVRGQLVVVENPGIEHFFADFDETTAEPTYILPQGARAILGGTVEPGNSDPRVDQKAARGILERCQAVQPALAGARVLGHRVGFRPGREEIRLEAAVAGANRVIHNYGHGGSGVSVCWGCASTVRTLIDEAFGRAADGSQR
jgi:D-amino-acid oxidase